MAEPSRFALDPALDIAALAHIYRATGRVQVPAFLSAGIAEQLHGGLRARGDWQQVITTGAGAAELSRAVRAGMTAEQVQALDTAVYAGARHGFQYRYETVRVPDEGPARAASNDPVAHFAKWLSEGDAREALRAITGADDIDFADAQATAFSPGDFLTGHDDAVDGKRRRAAYVFGLTPVWRTEWGGLLLFHEGGSVSGFAPALNTLNLFRVPQMHSVSEVTRAAAYRRYSVTGWLRAAA